jgi:hypothetical protein
MVASDVLCAHVWATCGFLLVCVTRQLNPWQHVSTPPPVMLHATVQDSFENQGWNCFKQ